MTSNSKLTNWLLIVVILLLTVSTSATLYMLSQIQQDQNPGSEEEEVVEREDLPPPMFVTIGPLTVNLQNDDLGNRLLYIGLSLRVLDEESQELLQTHMPDIKSRLLVLLSSQSASELTTQEGKEALRESIMALVSQPLDDHLPQPAIHSVLYTDFIVQ